MRRLIAVLSILAMSSACGGAGSPSAPGSLAGGATISGSIISSSTPASASVASIAFLAGGSGLTVSVVGTAMTYAVDSSNRFSFRDVPAGDLQLKFSGGGVDAQLSVPAVQNEENITLAVSLSSSSATVDSMSRHTGNAEQLEGRIESLPPTVPANSFIAGGRTVQVDLNTKLFLGGTAATFADLAIGIRVHVKGHTVGSALLAEVIEIQNTNPDIPVEINGIVKEFSGAVSAFQFKIDGRLIKGDALTEFFGNSVFADLANDARAEVKGQQRNGFVYASRIHVNVSVSGGGQDQSASIEGPLTSKSGLPPMLTLVVGGTTVHTSSSTDVQRRGDKQDLSVLQIGMTLHVVGVRQSNGSIDARLIQIKDDASGALFEIEGPMGGVKGTCPSIQFGINGYSIYTDGSTTFTPNCSTLKSGTKAKVKGVRQADGSVKATSIEKQ